MRERLTQLVEQELLPNVKLHAPVLHNPVVAEEIPDGWECIGRGNYAAVFVHQQFKDWVVKVYAHNYESVEKEVNVYHRLGVHPAYSQLIASGPTYLILKRLNGLTLYEAVHRGILIPESVIKDVNKALEYAKKRGLNPVDVHGKNVMMNNGKGYVVDVSDFYKKGSDQKWKDLVKAYYRIYLPFIYKYQLRVPYWLLDVVRHSYRFYRKFKKK
jgi:hypothetical protein